MYLAKRNVRRGLFEQKGPLRTRSFDMALYTWTSALDPNREDYMNSRNIPSEKNGGVGNNYPGYRNARVDELSTKGASTIDEKARKPIYCELQQIWTDELPVLPLFQRVSQMIARARLQNFKPTPSSTPETWNVYEWAMA